MSIEFTDAIAIAKGCGGLVTALKSAAKNGMDSQTSVLHAIGTNW